VKTGLDGALRRVLVCVFVATAFLTGIVVGQNLYQASIQYSIVADVYVEMQNPLNLGTLASPSVGSKTFPDAITIKASKSGYIYLTFTLAGDLTAIVNHFDNLTINIANSGGVIVTLDLNHLTATYTLPTPQTISYNIEVVWATKEAVTATGEIILSLEVT
jgi:hypothetical protein